MLVKELVESLGCKCFTGDNSLLADVSGVYSGDLLSWVMSHASPGNAWITVRNHINIVAVAHFVGIWCIILPECIRPEQNTIDRANLEGIAILGSDLNSVELIRKIDELFQ